MSMNPAALWHRLFLLKSGQQWIYLAPLGNAAGSRGLPVGSKAQIQSSAPN